MLQRPIDQSRIAAILSKEIGLKAESLTVELLKGDASNRAYYRLRYRENGHPGSMILMQLAEPEAFKKSEEKVNRTTIPIKGLPFINILTHLARWEVAVPELHFYEKDGGWLFLQDLGDLTVEKAVRERSRSAIRAYYEQAIDELIKIQTRSVRSRSRNCVAFGRAFEAPLLMWEFDHFLEYGIPYRSGRAMIPSDRKKVRRAFLRIAEELARLPRTFTHRDYHSRNLMIHQERIWVLDFQDALMGPHVYDLASLLRDSYTVLEESLVEHLLAYYREGMDRFHRARHSPEAFRRLFDRMSLQRNLKAAGRFVYIDRVKHNPNFLPYISQTLGYVRRNLERYSELSELRSALGPYLEGIVRS